MSSYAPSSSPENAIADEVRDNSQVLKRLNQGGEDALAALFMERREHLKAMIYARLDRRLHARVDSSDIVQEVYLRAVKGLGKFLESPQVHPIVWLRLIGKHIVTETHRRHFRAKRSPEFEVNGGEPTENQWVSILADSIQSVHSVVARAELVQKVYELFAEIPQQDREVLEMRHAEGLSMSQIGDLLEINVEAAKKRYYRALARFRTTAADILEGDE